MGSDEIAVPGIFERDALLPVLQKELAPFRDKNQRFATGRLESSGIVRGIFRLRRGLHRGRGGKGFAGAVGPHHLDGILRDRIGTVTLHGVYGGESADPFIEINVQGGGKRDHAAGMPEDAVAIKRIDGNSVSVARRRAKLFGFDVGFCEERKAFFAEQAFLGAFAGSLSTTSKKLYIESHVVRCRCDAARGGAGHDGGGFAEFRKACERAIALESEIVFGGTAALIERDDRLGRRHAERVEDAFPIDFRKSAAVKRHQEVAQQGESHIVVVKLLAGGVGGAMLGGWVAEKDRRYARKAGGVGEQVMRGDWLVGGINAEPAEIIEDRLVQVELAFVA